jgi:hypothetical protein
MSFYKKVKDKKVKQVLSGMCTSGRAEGIRKG